MTIQEFLNKWGTKDIPDMPDNVADMLMDDHFYYIDSHAQGWFIKKESTLDTSEEETIRKELYYLKE